MNFAFEFNLNSKVNFKLNFKFTFEIENQFKPHFIPVFFISNLLPKHFCFAPYFKNLRNFLHSTLSTIHGPLSQSQLVCSLLLSFTEFLYILKGKRNVCSLLRHNLNKILSTLNYFSTSFRLFVCQQDV